MRRPDDGLSAGMGSLAAKSYGTKAYCVQVLGKVNGHLVKKFTSPVRTRIPIENDPGFTAKKGTRRFHEGLGSQR
jgi:hypothetical protein